MPHTRNQSSIADSLNAFRQEQKLPASYDDVAHSWFIPLAEDLASIAKNSKQTLIIGINGAQGSGKSTLSALLSELLGKHFNLNVANLSIDDFYLTQAQRKTLAKKIHPLLVTRGVPGTHDTELLKSTLTALKHSEEIKIPRFDKAIDERLPKKQWQLIDAPVDIILLEGWCLGTRAQNDKSLTMEVNTLEKSEDPNLIWRTFINQKLKDEYHAINQLVDVWVMLQAPSFEQVFTWRLEQEQKLAAKLASKNSSVKHLMSDQQVKYFIAHFQRLTKHTLLTLPKKVNYLFKLNEQRNILSLTHPTPMK